MKLDKYLRLSFKRLLWIIGAWVLAVLMHNVIYAVFNSYFMRVGGDEAVFFIIAIIIIPAYFLLSLIYTLVRVIFFKD